MNKAVQRQQNKSNKRKWKGNKIMQKLLQLTNNDNKHNTINSNKLVIGKTKK